LLEADLSERSATVASWRILVVRGSQRMAPSAATNDGDLLERSRARKISDPRSTRPPKRSAHGFKPTGSEKAGRASGKLPLATATETSVLRSYALLIPTLYSLSKFSQKNRNMKNFFKHESFCPHAAS
jgi:hypothetical protein